MSTNLALFLGRTPTLAFAVAAATATGGGWVAAAFGITYLVERRPFALWLINAGYHSVALLVMGLVLGGFAMPRRG